MKVRDLVNAKLGAWVFGSAVAWGCISPGGVLGSLLGGQEGVVQAYPPCNLTNQVNCGGGNGCNLLSACTCACDFAIGTCPLTCTSIEGHNCPVSQGCTGPAHGSACMGGATDGHCYY